MTSSPPGASRFASAFTNAAGSATCSMTSIAVIEVELPVELVDVTRAIIDREAHPGRMIACHRDDFRGRVDPGHCRAKPGQRLGQQPGAAADIERILPTSGVRLHSSACQCWSIWSRTYLSRTGLSLCSIADRAVGVPPVAGEPAEALGFLGKDACLDHAPPPNRARPVHPRSTVPRIVMKFGGTSMAGIERIRSVAERVRREADAATRCWSSSPPWPARPTASSSCAARPPRSTIRQEYDVVVASGEQVTSGLLAMTLQNMGLKARSFMGWQLVRASGVHGNARVEAIESAMLDEALSRRHRRGDPRLPGRLGRRARGDTRAAAARTRRAVAIAAGVKADRCDIYTDVDGVYTTDPRIVPRARKLGQVTFEEMLELAGVGAKVLQVRSVGLAMRENLPLAGAFGVRGPARHRHRRRAFRRRKWSAISSPASPPTATRRGSR